MKKLQKILKLAVLALVVFCQAIPALAAVDNTGFADVAADAWYAEAVSYCRDNGLMNGNSATSFDPEDSLTRAMLVTVLYRVENEPAVTGDDGFSDTADGQWYSSAVLWATQKGVVNGYGEGLFGPNDPITQEQLNLIMNRYTDVAVTQDIPTFDGSTSPATRAQVAAVLFKLSTLSDETPNENPRQPENNAEPKILVAYFSATNNTENVAKHVAAAMGADIYEITPETPYTSEDLNYGNSSSRTSLEMNDPTARPAISGSVANMADYDIVFLGYPIWWGQAPKIVCTFIESHNFSGKTIVPFCTSGSSGIGSSATNLHSLANGANWLEGKRFSGGATQAEVTNWLNGLAITTDTK